MNYKHYKHTLYDIIYNEFKNIKKENECNANTALECKFVKSLSKEQYYTYTNIVLAKKYETNNLEKELIKFVLNYISKLCSTKKSSLIMFD